jgi:aminopeptidase YwaD
MKKAYLLPVTCMVLAASLNAQEGAKRYPTTPGQLKKHVYFLASDSLLGRGFGTPQGLQAAHYIAGQFREAGLEPLDGSYLHPFNYRYGILNIPGNNVVGVIPGSDPVLKDEYIVLGAHYDHLGWKVEGGDTVVYNGADDNASGTASIIEIGRNLAANRSSLGRSIIIVSFDGEESGLIGSEQFLKDSIVPPHRVKLMFSLDMVGMVEANGGVDLVGVRMLEDYQHLITGLSNASDLAIAKASRRLEQRTDTAPFGRMGIPSVHVFTGTKSPYHKPEDDADRLDYKGMASVANYMTDVAMFLSSTEKLSKMEGPWEGKPEPGATKVIRPGIKLNLGSSQHNYMTRYYKGKSIFAGGAGLLVNIRAAGFLYIQPEVVYETRGSEHQDGVFRTHTVTTPLHFQISTPVYASFRSYMQLGGYYSYLFGGKIGDVPIDFDHEYMDHEFGISFGAGFELMKVQCGVCFERGLTDVDRAQEDKIRHETVHFTLGYFF